MRAVCVCRCLCVCVNVGPPAVKANSGVRSSLDLSTPDLRNDFTHEEPTFICCSVRFSFCCPKVARRVLYKDSFFLQGILSFCFVPLASRDAKLVRDARSIVLRYGWWRTYPWSYVDLTSYSASEASACGDRPFRLSLQRGAVAARILRHRPWVSITRPASPHDKFLIYIWA